jgi:carbon monoxide dehydrogenase subunit G
MIEIAKSRRVNARVEKVWDIVSNLEREHEEWPFLREVRILGRTDDSVKREVKVSRGPMGDATSAQTLTIDPSSRSTMLRMTGGPMIGSRKIELSEASADQTRIDVKWEFEMKGVPKFAMGFVKTNISDVTDKALAQISARAEGDLVAEHGSP